MKCQILLSGQNKKNIINMWSAENWIIYPECLARLQTKCALADIG